MKKSNPYRRRLIVVLSFLAAVLVFFGVMLFNYQIVNGDEYRALSVAGTAKREVVETSRGIITDRNGKVLVSNRLAYTLVFDRSCTKRWANAIGAFRNMHLITDESVEVLKAELLQMLDELEEICASGQFRSGRPVSVYISDMDIEATYCYLSARHYRASCIDAFSINSLRSADPHMFEHMKRWIMSLSRFASLISCSGELQRIHFFKRQRAVVAELEREGLEPSPEVFQE